MRVFRYEGAQQNGTPVFGTMDAECEPDLRAALAARGVRLLQAQVLSLDGGLGNRVESLPRLHQLRVGERLREAFLTGLPAHDAIRAMSAEPFQHPVLAIMPWMFLLGCLSLLPAVGWSLLVPGHYIPLVMFSVFALVVIPIMWCLAHFLMDLRPRRLLNSLAAKMESGAGGTFGEQWGFPSEVQSVMRSQVNDQQKALAVADLVPALMGSRFHHHRFLLSIVGSLAFALSICLGFYLLMWQIVPQFNKIFMDFGTELPLMTLVLVQFSEIFASGGLPGFSVSLMMAIGLLLLVYFALTTGRVAELISHVPLFGLPVRWLMQARVSRVLASMLRYDSDRAEALLAATSASTFPAVQRTGKYLAEGLRSGRGITGRSSELAGLPLSLLAIQPQSASIQPTTQPPAGQFEASGLDTTDAFSGESLGWSNQRIAENFTTLAHMLEQASHGQGRFLGVILQYTITIIAAAATGYVVIALFLPLIKLLNDLS